MAKHYERLRQLTLLLFFATLLVYVLVAARDFLYPIAMAILFAYLLYPIEKQLEKWGLPRIPATFLTIIAAMALFVGLLLLLYKQLAIFLTDLPALQNKALLNLDRLQQAIDEEFSQNEPENEHWLRTQLASAIELSGNFLRTVLFATTSTITKFGLIPVYIFLMLYYRNKFLKFILYVVPTERHAKTNCIIDQVSDVTRHYMGGVISVILILCALNTVGLLAIGVEYALLLGILSAIMNFIPYFGTLIGGAIPLFYTFMIQGSPHKALLVLVFFLIIQFTENNILTPNITGSSVNINPMFTILSIVVGGMLWGLPGMFVAVPFLGMIKVYCDHTPPFAPFAFLLGTAGTEEHAFTAKKIIDWFRSKFKS
ncbi:AI-2E family transporter [Pontibacter oryzae]|uniref:AI-2E family transporter n=1 Tax=Pontibacter oryzae TaxID=2304593 RepID=A0A399SCC8_9BACT|nr:AI-2E family transporter [Pontibacter oryzae]RIJ41726.1 AI-2E family transporter [Pontibacter oryzae]